MGHASPAVGEAVIEGVGGCNLGSRLLDFHYRGFARLGATVGPRASNAPPSEGDLP